MIRKIRSWGDMSFKDNLLKKIEIDAFAARVTASIGPPASGKKVDREAMRKLLEMGGYAYNRERDLDLYIREGDDGLDQIVVLDNELALYRTSPQDVVMRKSPTVKEMVSVRNAIKILKDSDVVVGRREATVKMIQKACLENLDLSYDASDIDALVSDGKASVENTYADGIRETLALFVELLGLKPPPGAIKIPHCYIAGVSSGSAAGEKTFGPMAIYNRMHDLLTYVDDSVHTYEKEKIENFHRVARGEQPAALEGADVFEELGRLVLT